jgi:predicted GNAT family acetyltransferase
VTALRPGLAGFSSAGRRARGAVQVSRLADPDLPEVHRLVARDPIVNAVIAYRLAAASSLDVRTIGGEMYGARRGGALVAACLHSGNLLTLGEAEDTAWAALAGALLARQRLCSAVVGRSDAVRPLWRALAGGWPPPRAVRATQPLLVTAGPVPVRGEASVRAAGPDDLERYLPAAAAMFAEELGISPNRSPGSAAFRARVSDLIRTGRAFAAFDFRGQVTFKADLGVVTAHTCQIQGVWVRPDLRGRGLGTAGLAAVLRHALTLAPTASLYVNDFNHAARRVYAKLGMREHSRLSTVLL